MFEKVLIATDFSKHAKKVIECIGEMPGLKEVLLLNVISRDPLARVWDPVSEIKDIEKKLEFLKTDPVASKLDAVRNNRVVIMDVGATRAGLDTVDGIETLAKAIAGFGISR